MCDKTDDEQCQVAMAEPEEGTPLGKDAGKGQSWWRRMLARRLPVTSWAGGYGRAAAAADAVAGLSLGLTLVPQSIAYAALADLPLHYGLYSSFVGPILYTFVGTVKEVSIGPTSLMALLTLQACRGLPAAYVVLLTLLTGCVVLLMGLLRLGFLVELISPSVTSGFTSATAVIIVVAQLKGALGLSFTAESVVDNLRQLAANAGRVRVNDCALALVCCALLLLLRKLKDLNVSSDRVKRALWLVSIGRNALVVLAAAALAYVTHDPNNLLVKLSGRVEPGLPRLGLPALSVVEGNSTVLLPAMLRRLAPAAVMLPAVMVVANIAIAKAFSGGEPVDATQEMLALGLCNVAGSLVGAMPACGAFTRAAVGHASGVTTPAAGIYCGVITLLALIFLTPYFYFIPKACLSSVLICAVIFMIDVKILRRLWRQDKGELCVLVLTLVVSVATSVELGMLAGVLGAALAVLLRLAAMLRAAAMTLDERQVSGRRAVRAWLPPVLVYANAGRVLGVGVAAARRRRLPLLADAGRLWLLDHSAIQALERVSAECSSCSLQYVVYNASAAVARRLAPARLDPRALTATTLTAALHAITEPGHLTPGHHAAGHHAAGHYAPGKHDTEQHEPRQLVSSQHATSDHAAALLLPPSDTHQYQYTVN